MRDAVEIPGEAGGTVRIVRYTAAQAAPVLLLAHGAGAGQQSAFIAGFAQAMADRDIATTTFDFPYITAGRRVPDRTAVLEATWRAVIAHAVSAGPVPLVIGGKSMGGRIASHVLTDPAHPQPGVAGLVLLGYPLHPPGRPDQPRTAHLPALLTPTLLIQGQNDPFGTEDEVRLAFRPVPASVDWLVIPGGDHSFKVPRARGGTPAGVMGAIHDTVAQWIRARPHDG